MAAGNNPVAHFILLQHHLRCEKTHASTGPYFVTPSAARVKAWQYGFTALCTGVTNRTEQMIRFAEDYARESEDPLLLFDLMINMPHADIR
jgi:hypothetical protein